MTTLAILERELTIDKIGEAMWDVREARHFATEIHAEAWEHDQETSKTMQQVLTSLNQADNSLLDAWNTMMRMIKKEDELNYETRR
jgi:hypothetical protein